jgi:hypothetical protein
VIPARHYARHRRAFTPRFWPLAVLCLAIVFPVLWFVRLTLLEGIALGLGVGVGVGTARWELWKWRHPAISRAEYVTDLLRDRREAARWN